jgi:hypothetical protein
MPLPLLTTEVPFRHRPYVHRISQLLSLLLLLLLLVVVPGAAGGWRRRSAQGSRSTCSRHQQAAAGLGESPFHWTTCSVHSQPTSQLLWPLLLLLHSPLLPVDNLCTNKVDCPVTAPAPC